MALTPQARAVLDALPDYAAAALLDPLEEKNRVRVTVTRRERKPHTRAVHNVRVDDMSPVCMTREMLTVADEIRALKGEPMIYLPEVYRAAGMELVDVALNTRTDVGVAYVKDSLGNNASRPAVAQYIALSNNSNNTNQGAVSTHTNATTPLWGTADVSDGAAATTRGEINYAGLNRGNATGGPAATYAGGATATTNYTMTRTWTATGAVTGVQVCGMFTSSTTSAGILFLESTFTTTTLASGDQLTLTWTVNV